MTIPKDPRDVPPPPPVIEQFQDCRKEAFRPASTSFVGVGAATFIVTYLIAQRVPRLSNLPLVLGIGTGIVASFMTSQREFRKCMAFKSFQEALKKSETHS